MNTTEFQDRKLICSSLLLLVTNRSGLMMSAIIHVTQESPNPLEFHSFYMLLSFKRKLSSSFPPCSLHESQMGSIYCNLLDCPPTINPIEKPSPPTNKVHRIRKLRPHTCWHTPDANPIRIIWKSKPVHISPRGAAAIATSGFLSVTKSLLRA